MLDYFFIGEGSNNTGLGHINRLSIIASYFLKHNHKVYIFVKNELCKKILMKFFKKDMIFGLRSINEKINKNKNKVCLFIDVFHKNIHAYAYLNNFVKTVIVVDDYFSNYAFESDILFSIGYKDYPSKHVKNKCSITNQINHQFSGKDYIVFRKEFELQTTFICRKKADRLLVSMGGTDPHNLTEFIIKALNENQNNYNINVIIGPGFSTNKKNKLESLSNGNKHFIKLIYNVNNISKLMGNADIAIINGGSTRFELALIGVPFLSISIDKNQGKISNQLTQYGLGIHLGVYKNLNNNFINNNIDSLISSFNDRKKISNQLINKLHVNGEKNIYHKTIESLM